MPFLGRIVLIGAGSLGRELAAWIGIKRVVYLDDIKKPSKDLPVIGKLEEIGFVVDDEDAVLVAQARPVDRQSVTRQIEARFPPTIFVHPTVITAHDVRLGSGSMILPGAKISCGTHLGKSLLVNLDGKIGHDVVVGDFVTLCSNVVLNGGVIVGDRVFIGTGALVAPGVKIGNDAYIGMGAVVVRDVGVGERVFGNPARTIKIAETA